MKISYMKYILSGTCNMKDSRSIKPERLTGVNGRSPRILGLDVSILFTRQQKDIKGSESKIPVCRMD